LDETWRQAAQLIVSTFKQQQRKESNGPYKFQRNTDVPTDTLTMGGYGNPTKKIGLIHSMFRPSDDACSFPFLIPANLFAVRSLFQLEEIALSVWKDKAFANDCKTLALEVKQAIEQYGMVIHPLYGKIYAYEVDGYGNALLMDDANVPSLLSLPYLVGMDPADAVYKNTRAFVLSLDNPFFYSGSAAQGIGGPHVGADMVWPLGIIMRGMTSTDHSEMVQCIKTLKATHAGTGFMHEAFHKNNPKDYTRSWFAWANTLFGEFILKVYNENPKILQQQF
jgi:meiotically up-regulated gene 157 (Mug157) protein